VSLQENQPIPLPHFQGLTELKYFPLLGGGTTIVLGCLIPLADFAYKSREGRDVWKSESTPLWERAEWSMPMRYIGGVIGLAWAASVLSPVSLSLRIVYISLFTYNFFAHTFILVYFRG
jgi:hypothetical protein